SFELIDACLTQISKVLPRLSADLPKARKSHAQAAPVNSGMVQDLEELRSSVSSIQSTTRKLQAHYGARRQKYGVLIFSQLARKSDAMQNGLKNEREHGFGKSTQSGLNTFGTLRVGYRAHNFRLFPADTGRCIVNLVPGVAAGRGRSL